MVDYIIDGAVLTGIADAIREKNGSSETLTPAEMATAISTIETGGGGGGDTPPPADNYTWEGVAYHINKGTYRDVYAIGDSVPLDLGSEGVINMQVAAFDTDILADGSGTAPITWVAKELLSTKKRLNPEKSAGTVGTGAVGGWEKCELRAYLADTILPTIPNSVRNQIVAVSKEQWSFDTSDVGFRQTTKDKVWVLGDKDLSGTPDAPATYAALFPDQASRVKSVVNSTSGARWWLRTAYHNAGYFHCVTDTGSIGNWAAWNVEGVCIGFCTGVTGNGGGGINYTKFTAKPDSTTSFVIENPLGGIARKVSIKAVSPTITSSRKIHECCLDWDLRLGAIKAYYSSGAVVYVMNGTDETPNNGEFRMTESFITLYRFNSATTWDTSCEYEIEIFQ